jgi:hypothetical protein
MRKLREEITAMFDDGDKRSFDEIYGDRMDLFEDVEDIIDPKMKKLFEATYQTGSLQQKHLKESEPSSNASTNPDHNFSGAEEKPKDDGIPNGHNNPGLGGADPQATQGQGRGDSNNAPGLFKESTFRKIYDSSKKL